MVLQANNLGKNATQKFVVVEKVSTEPHSLRWHDRSDGIQLYVPQLFRKL